MCDESNVETHDLNKTVKMFSPFYKYSKAPIHSIQWSILLRQFKSKVLMTSRDFFSFLALKIHHLNKTLKMFLPFQSCRVFFHKYSHAPIHSMYSLLLDQLFNSSKDLIKSRFFQFSCFFHQNLLFFPRLSYLKCFLKV